MDTTATAKALIHSYAEMVEAQRPIDKKTTKANFVGMTHVLGAALGVNGSVIYMDVLDAFHDHGGRPVATADNAWRKAWYALMVTQVDNDLRTILALS